MSKSDEKNLARRRKFEEKQYQSLSHKLEVGRPAHYFIVTMIIIVLVDLLDNFTTSQFHCE